MNWNGAPCLSQIKLTFTPLTEDFGIPLALMGIFVVFVALALVATIISTLPKLFPADVALPDGAAERRSSGLSDELAEETVVVIAAAVASVMTQPHRIVHIRGPAPGDGNWSLEGRVQQHHSHRMPPRGRR